MLVSEGGRVGKKNLTTLIRRPSVSCCVSPWLSSLRGEVTCLLAIIFTLDHEHVVMRARGLALLVLSQVHSWLLPS